MEKRRKVSYVICNICGRTISKSNIEKHMRVCSGTPQTRVEPAIKDGAGFRCAFCNEYYATIYSLRSHERLCAANPDRAPSPGMAQRGRPAWNKGLTIATSESVRRYAETYKENYRRGKHKPRVSSITEEGRQRLRDLARARGLHAMRKKGYMYNGVHLDSSYEVRVAVELDSHGVLWERPQRMPYYLNGDLRYYTPDFYLPEYDVYLDPKNDYLINNVNPHIGICDIEKIALVQSYNDVRIYVLDKFHLAWEEIEKIIN